MKSIRTIATTVLLTLGAFTAVVYTSCNSDKCKDVVCQNNGTCDGGTCTCGAGYEGTTCQTEVRAKALGVWAATDQPSNGKAIPYSSTIGKNASATAVQAIVISNFGDFFINAVDASVSGNTITINDQSPDKDGYSVSGTGTISGSAIAWSYSIKNADPAKSYTATGSWTK